MKKLLLLACLCATGGGDREQGLELYRDGKFAEAAAAFRAAIEHDGDAADLQWNLALASWRAGDLAAAETAAEKYAALATDARVDLHRGLLGAVRFAEAQAREAEAETLLQGGGAPPTAPADPEAAPPDPLPVLQAALAKAKQAKEHFVAGAAAKATPELLRNTERALRYIDELQKKIDELEKQREQQPKDDKQDQNDKDDKQDGKPEDKQDQKDDQQDGDQKDQQGESGEPKPGEPQAPPEPKPKDDAGKPGEPKPGSEPKDDQEPKPGEPEPPPPDPKQGEPRTDAPGEAVEGKQLTPEQAQRLLEQLKQLDGKLQQLRQGSKTGRRPVGRDW
jgi:tetratricopeptide (TPR) repeat protein